MITCNYPDQFFIIEVHGYHLQSDLCPYLPKWTSRSNSKTNFPQATDLVETPWFKYQIVQKDVMGVGGMYHRPQENLKLRYHFPSRLLESSYFDYLDEAEIVLERLKAHFQNILDRYDLLTKENKGEFANVSQPVCLSLEATNLMKIGLREKPRKSPKASLDLDSLALLLKEEEDS